MSRMRAAGPCHGRAEGTLPEGRANSVVSSIGEKHRRILLLRSMLIIATGGLLLGPGTRPAGAAALALILAYAASNVALLLVSRRLLGSLRFELVVGAFDLALVALGIQLAGAAGGALPVSCLLMVLVVALGHYRVHTVAGAAAVGALHSWLFLGADSGSAAAWQLALQVLFLCSVALYYGFLASGIHRASRQERFERFERRELRTLLEILDATTSSLDLTRVARTIVTKMSEIIPAMRCSMIFVNPERTRCFVMASHDDLELEMLEIELQKYPEIRKAIETRTPVLVQDVPSDPLMAEVRTLVEHLSLTSIMVVPMTFADDVLGTLCLKTARTEAEFTERETDFCKAVARASANALKNALLHRQVHEEFGRHRDTGAKLSSILEHSPDLIVTTDPAGRVTEFNRGAERLTGYPRKAVVGRPCSALFGAEAGPGLVHRILEAGEISNHSCTLNRRDGRELSLELNMAALSNENGTPAGTVWVGRDVTELKSAQLQLLQAKKLSTIGEVISGVAHELNNPLSGVLGFSQLLLARHQDSAMARELERIHESALRCQKIVKNLLSFARVHKPERRYLGVNGILAKTLALRRYQLEVNDIEVVRELEEGLPCTMLDFHQMQQVFLNLITNAQQAMAAARDRRGRLLVRTSSQQGRILVEIHDNGPGMDQDTLERIFDPFFTTKEQGQGTGLGLSVSYGIVKEHGGRIYARSRKSVGSSFLIELPIHEEEGEGIDPPEAPDPQAVTVEPPPEGKTVLVVDDEPIIIDLLVDLLGGAGYRVDTAANGNEAREKVGERSYDAIITDVRMPGMDGMQLYREILALRPEVAPRIIFITGDLIDRQTVEFLAEVGAKSIPKPLELPALLELVAATVDGGRECVTA